MIVIALLAAMLYSMQLATHEPQEGNARREERADRYAANFWTYRNSVVDFLAANPGFEGAVNDAALADYQDGFVKFMWADPDNGNALTASWEARVINGVLYAYTTVPPKSNVVWSVAQRGGLSMRVGITQAGSSAPVLTSISDGINGMINQALPAGLVPNVDGNLVVIGI